MIREILVSPNQEEDFAYNHVVMVFVYYPNDGGHIEDAIGVPSIGADSADIMVCQNDWDRFCHDNPFRGRNEAAMRMYIKEECKSTIWAYTVCHHKGEVHTEKTVVGGVGSKD